MRILFVSLALVGALLVAANYFGENVAEQRIEDGVRAAFRGQAEPEAEIGGGVFLLQLLGGRFDRIDISIPKLAKGGMNLNSVELTLSDVDFELSSVIEGTGDLTIGRGRGSGTVDEESIQVALARRRPNLEVTIDGDRATLSGRGLQARVEELTIERDALTLNAPPLGSLRFDLPPPPRGFDYESVEIDSGGLSIGFEVSDRTLSL